MVEGKHVHVTEKNKINSLELLKLFLNRLEACNLSGYVNIESRGSERHTTSSLKAKYRQVFDHVELSKPRVQPPSHKTPIF
jgi:hypothetical protein